MKRIPSHAKGCRDNRLTVRNLLINHFLISFPYFRTAINIIAMAKNDESITKSIAQAVARSYTPYSTPITTTTTTDNNTPSTSSSSSSSSVTTAGAIQSTIDRIINKDTVPLLERPIVPASDTRYSQHRCHPRLQVCPRKNKERTIRTLRKLSDLISFSPY